MEYRSIEIDMDVHKAIETARSTFSESPNEVLRRLLGLTNNPNPEEIEAKTSQTPTGRSWLGKGVELPHGTKLRMSHNGVTYHGEVSEGQFIAEGDTYRTPSGAAGAVASTKTGDKVPLNGWYYWEALKPGARNWKRLQTFKK